MMKECVFSGMRPTGRLHLGHLAGALSNWLKLQEEFECYYCIVDWHALMSEYMNSSAIKGYCKEILLDWLAVGLDPNKAVIFQQSHVCGHAELHLALSMIAPLGRLERNPIYKEQLENMADKDLQTYGFLGYPVLMAADILLYKATKVPVGEDQSIHLEIAKELARRFNSVFREVFPEPEMLLTPTPRVPGIDGRKMSKSYNNALFISEDLNDMWDKVRTMMTDPARMKRTDPGEPEKCPVWELHKVFTLDEDKRAELAHGCRTAGIGCIDCKKVLMDWIKVKLEPIQERRRYFETHGLEMMDILREGAKKASEVASKTMDEVKSAVGFILL
ncbi:tryptophanyl-tRNA synthetase [Acetomicrobium mobile DSM 13181]|uniref:Tryptophan--tRNA ligase n=1 Tax=Acetomicrobium mobile (strain ATCC BAA-54 / DSM 13181 / JCM 12221 / NGA) TaxID=891968 RepID=I4BWD3_ACEMN|nr:tryptophanyl-tRNA synthetase [Acetomicrobium mobile DSM 13181]